MGEFSFKNNTATKTLEVSISGVITVQEAVDFLNKYKKSVLSIAPTQYSLVFDCEKLGIGTKESVEKLEECFKLYKQANFKNIIFKVGTNSILKLQLNRLSRAINLERCEIK